MAVRIFNKTKYDRLTNVLKNWYSEEQVNEIWGLLKDYDNQLMSSDWIKFKEPAFIGVDYDCKGNPLIDWKDKLKLQSDDDTIGYDFKVVAYRKAKVSNE